MLFRVHLKCCLVLPVYEEGLGRCVGFLTGIDFGCVCCYFVCGSQLAKPVRRLSMKRSIDLPIRSMRNP